MISAKASKHQLHYYKYPQEKQQLKCANSGLWFVCLSVRNANKKAVCLSQQKWSNKRPLFS